MRLAPFIQSNAPQIVEEWETFAQSLTPAADYMTPHKLRNHIAEILVFIVKDIESIQTEAERKKKSRGKKPKEPEQSAAEIHAALRQAGGFDMDQMVSEFRALRASVIKLWGAQLPEPNGQDILDITRFNESIDQQLTEAINYYSRKLSHSRDLFLGILGHDLRNPIGAMRMSAQLIGKIGPLNERQAMLAGQVTRSGDRALEILDRLLDLTRARLGTLTLIKKSMDMGFVGRQLVEEMRAMHPGRTFSIDVLGNTEGDWDRPRIGQVISNLLGNAVQYGFADLPIRVTIHGEPDEVILTVHNDGVPIHPAVIRKIFQSLTRGDQDGEERPGSTNLGLGLFITSSIVTAHGGTIGVTSSEKGGTDFTARFPRVH